jgi:branched-chain amino acid transport system permease protein
MLMIWLPDGLLSIPDRIRAKRLSREASATRAAVGQAPTLADAGQSGVKA